MIYCDKCGSLIIDKDKPCPTCGMYLNDNYNKNVSKKDKIPNFVVVIFVLAICIFTLSFINVVYSDTTSSYSGYDYYLEYANSLWTKISSDDEYLVLLYDGDSSSYLYVPNSSTDLSTDLEDDEKRELLYDNYVANFKSSQTINYNNITSGIEKLADTDYYYLTADFYKYEDSSSRGKIYLIYTSSGKVLTFIMQVSDGDINSVDHDVFDIIETLEL